MDLSSLVACDAPKFCCGSGVQEHQECKGKCIEGRYVLDGKVDCNDASDEGGISTFYVGFK